jgi:hypothetical protein
MLGLNLRSEFTGKRLSGTTIDFTNRHGTGALDKSASDFLNITYPSIDLLKTIEAVEPGKSRPTVIIGARGQGKSHLMAAVSHMLKDSRAVEKGRCRIRKPTYQIPKGASGSAQYTI